VHVCKHTVSASGGCRNMHVCYFVCVCVQLKKLMVRTNIGDDYSIDPIVQEACDPVVRSGCPNVRPGDRRLIQIGFCRVSI